MDGITDAAYLWVAHDQYFYTVAMNTDLGDYREVMLDELAPDSVMVADLLGYVDWEDIHKTVRDE